MGEEGREKERGGWKEWKGEVEGIINTFGGKTKSNSKEKSPSASIRKTAMHFPSE